MSTVIRTRIIIQCRTTSSRLPGKAFLCIQGLPTIIVCAKRAMNCGADVCVATSDAPSDDALAQLLLEHNIAFFRGPLNDVLHRYVLASEDMSPSDYVVRLTADNLFPDGTFVQRLINETIAHQWAYATTDHLVTGLPHGLGGEIFTVALLRQAHQHAVTIEEREHVNPWMRSHVNIEYVFYPIAHKLDHLRCTLDTLSDFIHLLSVFRGISDPLTIGWPALLDILRVQQDKPITRTCTLKRPKLMSEDETNGT